MIIIINFPLLWIFVRFGPRPFRSINCLMIFQDMIAVIMLSPILPKNNPMSPAMAKYAGRMFDHGVIQKFERAYYFSRGK